MGGRSLPILWASRCISLLIYDLPSKYDVPDQLPIYQELCRHPCSPNIVNVETGHLTNEGVNAIHDNVKLDDISKREDGDKGEKVEWFEIDGTGVEIKEQEGQSRAERQKFEDNVPPLPLFPRSGDGISHRQGVVPAQLRRLFRQSRLGGNEDEDGHTTSTGQTRSKVQASMSCLNSLHR